MLKMCLEWLISSKLFIFCMSFIYAKIKCTYSITWIGQIIIQKNDYKTLFADNRGISSYTFNDFIVMQRKNARLCKSDALSCQKFWPMGISERQVWLCFWEFIHCISIWFQTDPVLSTASKCTLLILICQTRHQSFLWCVNSQTVLQHIFPWCKLIV